VKVLDKFLNNLKPFLKWVGGKRQLLPEILKHVPKTYSTYYEPFVGAGALFFELMPEKAVINDLNQELILTYKAIKSELRKLTIELENHVMNDSKEYFYEVRNWDRLEDFTKRPNYEKAARLMYMNKVVYNGLYRVNGSGHFNVPYGKYKNPNILDKPLLKNISKYLKNADVRIISSSYLQAVKDVKKGDFVYFDPPYDPLNETSAFTSYQKDGFSKQDQMDLKNCADRLVELGAKVILSNSNTNFIIDLYSNQIKNAKAKENYYEINLVDALRHINSNPDARGKIKEVLIVSKEL
jgi:DNA adenine methylase